MQLQAVGQAEEAAEFPPEQAAPFWQNLHATSAARRQQAQQYNLPETAPRTAVAPVLQQYVGACTWPDGTPLPPQLQRRVKSPLTPHQSWLDGEHSTSSVLGIQWNFRWHVSALYMHVMLAAWAIATWFHSISHFAITHFASKFWNPFSLGFVLLYTWVFLCVVSVLACLMYYRTHRECLVECSEMFLHVQMLHLLYVADMLLQHQQATAGAVPHPLQSQPLHALGLRYRRGVVCGVAKDAFEGVGRCCHVVRDDGSVHVSVWGDRGESVEGGPGGFSEGCQGCNVEGGLGEGGGGGS